MKTEHFFMNPFKYKLFKALTYILFKYLNSLYGFYK